MDQRAIVLHFSRKGLSTIEIHADLVATLGPESLSYPSVTHYLHQEKFGSLKPNVFFSEPELELDDSNAAVLLTLSEQRFALIPGGSAAHALSRPTVYRHLAQTLEFHVRHLRLVPYRLSDSQKSKPVDLSEELLNIGIPEMKSLARYRNS
jgi:hypothetical protein